MWHYYSRKRISISKNSFYQRSWRPAIVTNHQYEGRKLLKENFIPKLVSWRHEWVDRMTVYRLTWHENGRRSSTDTTHWIQATFQHLEKVAFESIGQYLHRDAQLVVSIKLTLGPPGRNRLPINRRLCFAVGRPNRETAIMKKIAFITGKKSSVG